MTSLDLVLGIDSSTQGTAGVVLDRGSFTVVRQIKLNYRDDPRLSAYLPHGVSTPLLPTREDGEADQPPMMYLAALDALFDDLGPDILGQVAAINVSAQQHGQVWLTRRGTRAITGLRRTHGPGFREGLLDSFPEDGFARARAPIWMTASTEEEADAIRKACGGVGEVTARSGSNSPLRFSGAVLRRIALRQQEAYARTTRVHLISSFLTGVLCGDPDAPIDWGNGSGTSLMNWSDRSWDAVLLDAVAGELAGGPDGLLARLPRLTHPLEIVGNIAPILAERYGLHGECKIVAGSGDNPQTKVLAAGELLSLGTSFVLMTSGAAPHPAANAMYDGLGRPFLFGCRTNGAMVWESVRTRHGLDPNDFEASEIALATHAVGSTDPKLIFQPIAENFPLSPVAVPPRLTHFDLEYASAVDTSLALLYLASRAFAQDCGPLSVVGGGASSSGVLSRIAAIWGRPVVPLSRAGAALGASVAAALSLTPPDRRESLEGRARALAAGAGEPVIADQRGSAQLRAAGGYFDHLSQVFHALTGRSPMD